MTTNNTALAVRDRADVQTAEDRHSARALMRRYEERIVPFLPRGIAFERVMGEVSLACRENPAILQCQEDSIIRAVIRGLRMGLEIGVEFYLVPFSESYREGSSWKKRMVCTGIAGYKGLAGLAVRCGAARSVQAHCVYENDIFEMEHGLDPVLRHVPDRNPKTRGALLGAYYVIRLPMNAPPLFDFLPLADIEEVRAKSKQWNPDKVKECPPWWAKKRAVLAGLGLVPKNPRYAEALSKVVEDEAEEFGGEIQAVEPRLSLPPADMDDDFPEHPAARLPAGARSRVVAAPDGAYAGDLPQLSEDEIAEMANADPYGLGLDDQRPRRRSAIEEGQ